MMDFPDLLAEVSEFVNSDGFREPWRVFCKQHCDAFNDTVKDECALKHMAIHQKYEKLVDGLLTDGLRPDFPLSELHKQLPSCLQKTRENREEDPKLRKAGDAIVMLMSFVDFQAFVDMMIAFRLQQGAPSARIAKHKRVEPGFVRVKELLDACTRLADINKEEGWTEVATEPEWKLWTLVKDGRKILKYSLSVEMTVGEVRDMFCNFDSHRAEWDPSFKSSRILKSYIDENSTATNIEKDELIEVGLEIPAAFRWLMNIPDPSIYRIAVSRSATNYSYVVVSWDPLTDMPHTTYQIKKSGTLRPDGDRTIISGLEETSIWIPDWVLGSALKTMGRSKTVSLVASYNKWRRAQ